MYRRRLRHQYNFFRTRCIHRFDGSISPSLTLSRSGFDLPFQANVLWRPIHLSVADFCHAAHAYQLLKKGGLKDVNIVVFMYDDVAFNEENPRQKIKINSPHGEDVNDGGPKYYSEGDVTINNFFATILGNKTAKINSPHGEDVNDGVPKYYSEGDVTINNFFATILGNKTALTGGSGKVVDSGPNGPIFFYILH